MTYLARSFDLSSFGSGRLQYVRRLIGLDSADEFLVEYLDGTGWHTLEATGSGSANDATYVQKEFILPSGATGLRFGCKAGAVSEKCEVDDVSVFGQ
jgi:hypothetical protein